MRLFRDDDQMEHIRVKNSNRQEENQGPVVRRPISAQPGVKFNPGFFFLCSEAFSRIIFSVIFKASNHQLVDQKN